MTGTVTELTNAKALAGAKQRVDSLGTLGHEIKQNLATKDCAAADADKLRKLQGDLSRARTETSSEIAARADRQSADEMSAKAITGAALDKLIQNNPERQDELLSPFRELGRTPVRATKPGAAGLSDAPGSLTFPTGP